MNVWAVQRCLRFSLGTSGLLDLSKLLCWLWDRVFPTLACSRQWMQDNAKLLKQLERSEGNQTQMELLLKVCVP